MGVGKRIYTHLMICEIQVRNRAPVPAAMHYKSPVVIVRLAAQVSFNHKSNAYLINSIPFSLLGAVITTP